MDNAKTGLIAVGALALVGLAGGLLWWSGQTADPDVNVTEVPDPDAPEPGANPGELIRGGPDGVGAAPRPQGAGANQGGPDTGAPDGTGDDTGLTREGMIDEMIDDVAKDTGLSEEGRERMMEALQRARDGGAPEAEEVGSP